MKTCNTGGGTKRGLLRNSKEVTPSELDGQPVARDDGEGGFQNDPQVTPGWVDNVEMSSRDISRKKVDP